MTKHRWIGIALTLIVSALAYGLFLRHGIAPAVIGYNLVPSERVLQGQVPYHDFIYNYTPGVLWLNAVLFKLLGTTLLTARLGVYASKLATVLLLFHLARRYLPGWLVLLPVLMTLSWVGYGDILKVFPTQYGMALLLVAWALLNKSEATDRPGEVHTSWLTRFAMPAAAGALAGAVLIFKQNVGLFACAAVVGTAAGWVWLQQNPARPRTWGPALTRGLAAFAGIAVVTASAALFLASKSALLPMLGHFRRHAVAYEEAKGIALPPPTALVVSSLAALAVLAIGVIVLRKERKLIPHFAAIVTFLLLLVIAIGDGWPSEQLYRSLAAQVYYLPIYAVLAGAILVVAEYRGGNRARAAALIGLVLIPAAAFIEVFPRSDPDHLVRVLPPSLLLVCVLVYELGLRLAARRLFPSLLVAAAAVVISAIGLRVTWAPQFDGGFRMVENSPLEFERARGVCGSELEADRFNKIVEYVDQHTSPGDPIFTTARKMTAVYFFAARPNTTRLLWFDSAGIPRDDRDRVYQAIGERTYKLILVGGGADTDGGAAAGSEAHEGRVNSLLKEYYHRTELIDGISIFEPGPAVLEQTTTGLKAVLQTRPR